MCFRGGFSRNPDRRSFRHTCTTPTVSRLRWFSNVFGRYFLNRTVEHIPSTVMKGFHSLLVWNHSQRPISREGAHPFNWGRTLLVQLGGVFFDKTLAEGPSAAPVRFCLWHTVRIDSSCAQCKDRLVVPTASGVPPTVVPPASRVPPSRHCTF